MSFAPIAEFIIEKTLCEAPLRVSRARRQNDGQAALLYELHGAPLPAVEVANWLYVLNATALALDNTESGLALAIAEASTPLCALSTPLTTAEFLPIAVQL